MSLSTSYLVFYNFVQFLGWSYILGLCGLSVFTNDGFKEMYTYEVEFALKIFQTLAFLEVVHALLGLVKSNAVQTLGQVFSRNYIVWLIVEQVPSAKSSPGIPLLLFAWSITEVVRYSFYALQVMGKGVYLITWLRYTMFIVLYPMGVLGEMWTVYSAQPLIRQNQILSLSMPNRANFAFSFYQATWMQQFLWPLGLYQLYTYMLRQRSKVIGGAGKPAEKKQ
ncbi:very-long-chain (3R)-3-hydroxyacyl-CoA dehydratase hpo-8-like [Convolutriloba macropyga]|uniref:very-long-chain (3R)-3-hydroxyacyl-CoA dehydratase hpo-8-like n=1 Tax=Convolutriloba macropyga TaxID=536237 RepID=UPI003F5220B0